jgi:hypothetical protein
MLIHSRMPDIIDPVFGELRDILKQPNEPRRLYQGSVNLGAFGGSVGVLLETTSTLGVTDAHRDMFTDFATHQLERKHQILEAMFETYRDEYQAVYADAIGPEWADQLAPKVDDVTAFEKLLSGPSIHLDDRGLSVSYECTWDVEHGMGVRLEGAKILAVGLAGDV